MKLLVSFGEFFGNQQRQKMQLNPLGLRNLHIFVKLILFVVRNTLETWEIKGENLQYLARNEVAGPGL